MVNTDKKILSDDEMAALENTQQPSAPKKILSDDEMAALENKPTSSAPQAQKPQTTLLPQIQRDYAGEAYQKTEDQLGRDIQNFQQAQGLPNKIVAGLAGAARTGSTLAFSELGAAARYGRDILAPAANLLPQPAQQAIGNQAQQTVQGAGNILSQIGKIPLRGSGGNISDALQKEKEWEAQSTSNKDVGDIVKTGLQFAPIGEASRLFSGAGKAGEAATEQAIKEGVARVSGAQASNQAAMQATANQSKNVLQQIAKKESKVDKTITEGVNKGIKPTVVGKKTLKNADRFYDNANSAVKTIAENKNNIKLVDENGEAITHPRSSAEAAQAIDRTKKLVYKQYHDMAVSAGDAGSQFDISPIAQKLDEISADLKFNPETRAYAESVKNEIAELKGQSPEVIEARIADLNNSLAGFYDGRVTKAKAQIDGSVAKAMREQLDNNITNAVGEGYQDLKNKYGALKAIEKEVNHRAIVNVRKANKSIIDMTDIFTGGELIGGLITGNPALVAKSLAGRGIKEVYKSLNNPDRYIEKMFKQAYGLQDAKEAVGYKKPNILEQIKGKLPEQAPIQPEAIQPLEVPQAAVQPIPEAPKGAMIQDTQIPSTEEPFPQPVPEPVAVTAPQDVMSGKEVNEQNQALRNPPQDKMSTGLPPEEPEAGAAPVTVPTEPVPPKPSWGAAKASAKENREKITLSPHDRKLDRTTLQNLKDRYIAKLKQSNQYDNLTDEQLDNLATEHADMAGRSSLTDVEGMPHFNSKMEQIHKNPTPNTSPAFISADLDYFKPHNDTFGHEWGDKVLKDVMPQVNRMFKEKGIDHFHISGDENGSGFEIPKGKEQEYFNAINDIKDQLDDMELKLPNGKKINISMSFGISHKGYKEADDLLEAAKKSGKKNGITIDNEMKKAYNIDNRTGIDLRQQYKDAGLTEGYRDEEPSLHGQEDRGVVRESGVSDGQAQSIEETTANKKIKIPARKATRRAFQHVSEDLYPHRDENGISLGEHIDNYNIRKDLEEELIDQPNGQQQVDLVINGNHRDKNGALITKSAFTQKVLNRIAEKSQTTEGLETSRKLGREPFANGDAVMTAASNSLKDDDIHALHKDAKANFGKTPFEQMTPAQQDDYNKYHQAQDEANAKAQREPGVDDDEPLPPPSDNEEDPFADGFEGQRGSIGAKQQSLFGGEKDISSLGKEERSRLEKAEVQRRMNETKGGDADPNLPLFRGTGAVEGEQTSMFERVGGKNSTEKGMVGLPKGSGADMLMRMNVGTAGGVAGSAIGAKIGDTPEERKRNAIIGGVLGFFGGFSGTFTPTILKGLAEKGVTKAEAMAFIEKAKTLKPQNILDRIKSERGEIGAYHGSPHEFDKFDNAKIGTGERAQSFGHGLYFTNKEEIAKKYAKNLGAESRINKYVDRLRNEDLKNLINNNMGDKVKLKKLLSGYVEKNKKNPYSDSMGAQGVLDDLEKYEENTYQVTIHKGKTPDQYDYLKWDEPLSITASEKIKKQLGNIKEISINGQTVGKFNGKLVPITDVDNVNLLLKKPEAAIGKEMYHQLVDITGSPKAASDFLLKAGIDGIDYPAGSLSGVESKARNYVVFDPNAVTIEKRNGKSILDKLKSQSGSVGVDRPDNILNKIKAEKQGVQPDDKNLVALHNLDASNLLHADELGGLAMPSIAITKKDIPFGNFGDISLIADKRIVDPKTKMSKSFDADIYSPRYPNMKRFYQPKIMDETLNSDADELQKYFADRGEENRFTRSGGSGGYGRYVRNQEFSDNNMKYDPVIQYKFAKENGIKFDGLSDLEDKVFKDKKYDEYFDNILSSMTDSKKFFKGYTNSGSKKWAEYNLQNIVSEMKKTLRGGENFNYGAGNVRAQVAKKFSSIDAMKKESGRLKPAEEVEAIKDDFQKRLIDIVSPIAETRKSDNQFINADNVVSGIIDGLKRNNIKSELESYNYHVTDSDMEKINSFASDIRKAPTDYFEAKVSGKMALSDFAGAIIPKDANKRVRDALDKHGIKYVEYDPDIKGDRQQKVKEYSEGNKLNFAIAGGAGLAGAASQKKDNKGETILDKIKKRKQP
jgi:diguanylate cyclase (GGDEF)-like protein